MNVSIGFHAWAQVGKTVFKAFGKEEGLQNLSIQCITQDAQGFIWVGTSNGLHRFDGYSFEVFQYDDKDSTSLPNNSVLALSPGPYGGIWVGTGHGFARFDPIKQTFSRFKPRKDDIHSLPEEGVSHKKIHLDQQNRLWIASNATGRLYLLDQFNPEDPSRSTFLSYAFPANPQNNYEGAIMCMASNESDKLFIARMGGIEIFDPQTGNTLHQVCPQPFDENGLNSPLVVDLCFDRSGQLWAITNNRGANKIDLRANEDFTRFQPVVTRYTYDSEDPFSLNSTYGTRVTRGAGNKVWIGTGHGISEYQPESGKFINTFPDKDYPQGLLHNSIYDLFTDKDGNIWFGTGLGINMLPAQQPPFHHYNPPSSLPKPKHYRMISAIYKDTKGIIWLGGEEGVVMLNSETGTHDHIPVRFNTDESSLKGRLVKGFSEDSLGNMWILSGFAIHYWERQTGNIEPIFYKENVRNAVGLRNVNNLFKDSKGSLWIACFKGVIRFDPATRSFTDFELPADQPAHTLEFLEDRKGRLWIGEGRGLRILDPATGSYDFWEGDKDFPHAFPKINCRSLLEDRTGNIWAGTREGLYRFNFKEKTLDLFNKESGMNSPLIRSMEEDESGRIWISTGAGLSVYDPEEASFSNFSWEEGLPIGEFHSRASLKDQEGILYFGGTNGIISFDPALVKKAHLEPKIALTGFRLFNDIVSIGHGQASDEFKLEAAPSYLSALSLTHKESVFSFEFSGLEFYLPEQLTYAFQMEGFEDRWRITDADNRHASYTNLDPGSYTFVVKTKEVDSDTYGPAFRLPIQISPPWYKSYWAYLLYTLLFGTGIYAFFRFRIDQVKKEERLKAKIEQVKVEEREKVRARSSRDFHDEAGNNITKLALYTNLLKNREDLEETEQTYLQNMEKNIKELSSGMRDFIWVLDPRQDHLHATLDRIHAFGQQLFDHTAIQFHFHNQIKQEFDPRLDINSKRHLLLICKEAMNNALKYANCQEFSCKVMIKDRLMTLTMADDGLGFDMKNLGRINGLKNMESRAAEMDAELHIQAVPGMGTQIQLTKEIHPNG